MVRHEVKKYRKTLISCEKALWFIFVVSTNQTFNDKKVKCYKFPHRSEMLNSYYIDKIIYYCSHTDRTIILTLQFL